MHRQVKICIFTETYYPVVGGGETQARLLAEGLITNGHSVIILTRRSDAVLRQHEKYGAVSVYRLGPVGSGQLKKWGLLFSSIPLLLKLRIHYDLIFVSGYRILGSAAVLIGKLLKKPVILKADSQGEMSGDFFSSGLEKWGFSRTTVFFQIFLGFRNAILKKADAFAAISPEIASEWVSGGVPTDRIHLIPNGVDTTCFVPVDRAQKSLLRDKFMLPQNAIIAIYTGRLVSYKGLPLLLKVWKEIRCKHENVLLLLAGSGGLDIHNCEDELQAYVKSEGLEEYVLFTGVVRNVSEYLQAADIFVFPTMNEAFGISLVEAMACGLPVISTPVGAIKTLISHGENGLLVTPGDDKELYEALDVLINHEPLAFQLGQAARKSVQDLYSIETITRQYLLLFQKLVSNATGNRE